MGTVRDGSPTGGTRDPSRVGGPPDADPTNGSRAGIAGLVAPARQTVRWGLQHGLLRLSVRPGLRSGDVTALLTADAATALNPYPAYEQLRARGRLVEGGRVLHTVAHDLTVAVLRSPDFRTAGGQIGPDAPRWLRALDTLGGRGPLNAVTPPSMLVVDGADHARYRRLVTRAFSAKAVAALRARTEQVATELLDAMAATARAGDPVDLVTQYAALLPATVIAEVLGAPVSMRAQFLAWGASGAAALDQGMGLAAFRATERDGAAFQAWMMGHFDRLRRTSGTDVLSGLAAAHDDGALSADELAMLAMLLLAAGFETTVNLIGNGVDLLLAHPEQLAGLRADPAGWPRAVEEVLRIEPPVQRTGRIAVRATEVAGEPVAAGRIVITHFGGANRDPAVFPDPHRFDTGRAEAGEHVAFSSGPHHCIGAALARMEGEVALRALFTRFPDLAQSGRAVRRPTRLLRGFARMPVALGRER